MFWAHDLVCPAIDVDGVTPFASHQEPTDFEVSIGRRERDGAGGVDFAGALRQVVFVGQLDRRVLQDRLDRVGRQRLLLEVVRVVVRFEDQRDDAARDARRHAGAAERQHRWPVGSCSWPVSSVL